MADLKYLQQFATIAVVGAGGKTTLCWRLVQQARANRQRAIFLTTTKIWHPAREAFDLFSVGDVARLHAELLLKRQQYWRIACIMAGEVGEQPGAGVSVENPHAASNDGWHMPVTNVKMRGFEAGGALSCHPRNSLYAQLIIEADGARGRLIKAPGDDEPAIPPHGVDAVCVVVNIDCIGQPLSDATAFHPEVICRRTGAVLGEPLTATHVRDLTRHAQGGLKGIAGETKRIAVLTHTIASAASQHDWLAGQLRASGYDAVLTLRV